MIAAARKSPILDPSGKPFIRPQVRQALAEARAQTNGHRRVDATYDAARSGTGMDLWWANADRFDADSANSRGVRETLVIRSRYEIGNNGYADGIAQTYATDLIGDEVPLLRMETQSARLNRFIEDRWYRWCKAVHLRRKLWCMAHAKLMDGESFGIVRANPRVRHDIKLDVQLIETEMCQTPWLPFEPGYIDGIRFDRFGEPIWYDVLRYHPGSHQMHGYTPDPERVPAQRVLHWYKLRRPGQHRGVPETASSLNTGAAGRRFREATISAAETAAELNVLLKTSLTVEDEPYPVEPMSLLDIQRKMMTTLPDGWDAMQMKSEHPTAQYAEFMKGIISEQARPKNMPYNKAAADSSRYNYASGRLDHQTYYASLNSDRADCDDMVMTKLFYEWLWEAGFTYGLLGGRPDETPGWDNFAAMHSWRWAKHQVADLKAEAEAQDKHLKNGTLTLSRAFEEQGLDFEEELLIMAADYGMEPDEMRMILLASIHNANHEMQGLAEVGLVDTEETDDQSDE